MRALHFILPYLKSHFRWFAVGLAATALVSILTWLGPKAIAFIIDRGVVERQPHLLWKGVIALAAIELGRLFFLFLSQTLYSILGQNVIESVRSKMIAHLLRLPVRYFDRVTSGGMMTRVVNDANSMTDFFQSGFVSILGNVATIIAIFFGLFSLDLLLGAALLVAFIPSVVACIYFSERLRVVYEQTRNQLAFLNSILADFLFGMKTIRSLGLGFLKRLKLNKQIQKYAHSQMQMVKTFALFHPSYTLGLGLMMLLWLVLGMPRVSDGEMLIGEWVAALSYIVALQNPLIEISDRWNFFLAGLTSIERIAEVMDEVPESNSKSGGERLLPAPAPQQIRFEQVSFSYFGTQRHALKSVDWTLKRGDRIGIYGESGSGKSTLLQLLYGFYEPDQGQLTWNGKPYSSYELKSIRSFFGVVEQFPFLFAGTIEQNIQLFDSTKSLDSLRQEFVGFSLIESLLNRPHDLVTERGSNLSMGQRQMIAFLRSYLTQPTIWVLDEATAFFDPQAELELMRALDRLGDQIILVQVAHRPEALRFSGVRLNVSKGQVQRQL